MPDNPVLLATLPLKSLAVPPVPTLTLPPLLMMSPPLVVPAAVLCPAFRVIALALAFVVATAPDKLRLPASVATLTVPLALTAPSVMALLSMMEMLAPETTTAPVKLLPTLLRVMLFAAPAVIVVVPVTPRAAVWVMAPLLVSIRFSAAVIAPPMAMLELFNSVVLSLKVVAPPTVIAPALELPMEMPENPLTKLVEKFVAVSCKVPMPPSIPIVVPTV